MNWLDIVVVAVAGFAALVGWRTGGLHMAVTGGGILAGIALASRLRERVSPLFSRFIDSDDGAEITAFIAIFILALIGSVLAGIILRAVLNRLMMGWTDRAVGLALGIVVTLVIGSAVFSAIQSHPVFGLEDTIGGSTLGTFLADNFDVVLRGPKFIPGDLGT